MLEAIFPEHVCHLSACLPWPDGFPVALAEWGRERILRTRGLELEDYGTDRMVRGSAAYPRIIRAEINVPWGDRRRILIESLPEEIAAGFENLGLRFAGRIATSSPAVIATLEAAVDTYITRVPCLAASVASLARVLHVLQSEHDDFDTSYSDPDLPYSVFVSVPSSRRIDGPLRVAEALVHETMHLQLSLLERIVPLIDPNVPPSRLYSPWRRAFRDAGGVLHALYVFRVIEQFWAIVGLGAEDDLSVEFANSRRTQIEREIGEIADFRHCPSLTQAGAELVAKLLDEGGP